MKFDVQPCLRIDGNKNVQGHATVFFQQDDLKFSMRASDDTFSDGGLSTKGVQVTMKKEDNFEFEYDLGDHAPSFCVHTGCTFQDRKVNMKFKHSVKPKAVTMMEASSKVNDDNRLTVMYDLTGYEKPDVKRMSVKWRYTKDDLSIEPGYNFGTESVFAKAEYKMDDENRVIGHFDVHTNKAKLEWINNSGMGGGGELKVMASMCLDSDGMKKMPTIKAEKMWSFDV